MIFSIKFGFILEKSLFLCKKHKFQVALKCLVGLFFFENVSVARTAQIVDRLSIGSLYPRQHFISINVKNKIAKNQRNNKDDLIKHHAQ
jgi:hypothetical protein